MREVLVGPADVQHHPEPCSERNNIPHEKALVVSRKHRNAVREEETHAKIAIDVWLEPQLRRREEGYEISDSRAIGTIQTRHANSVLVHRRERIKWNMHWMEMHAANRYLKYSTANAATR